MSPKRELPPNSIPTPRGSPPPPAHTADTVPQPVGKTIAAKLEEAAELGDNGAVAGAEEPPIKSAFNTVDFGGKDAAGTKSELEVEPTGNGTEN